MIALKNGDDLKTDAKAIVNTATLQGVIGPGMALAIAVGLTGCSASPGPVSEQALTPAVENAQQASSKNDVTREPSERVDNIDYCAIASSAFGMAIVNGDCLGIEHPAGHQPPAASKFDFALAPKSQTLESGSSGVFTLTVTNTSASPQVFKFLAGMWPAANEHRVFDNRGNQVGISRWDQCAHALGGLLGVQDERAPKSVFVRLAPNGRISTDLRIRSEVFGPTSEGLDDHSSDRCPRTVRVLGRMWGVRPSG